MASLGGLLQRLPYKGGEIMLRKLLFVVVLLAAASTAMADDSFFDRHEVSFGYAPFCKHLFSDNPDYNENNNHLFMLSVDQWFGMTFRNSYFDRCFAFGYNFRTRKWKLSDNFYIRGNLPLGVVHGYHNRNIEVGGWAPAAIPTLEFGYANLSIHIAVFPVGSLMLTWTF